MANTNNNKTKFQIQVVPKDFEAAAETTFSTTDELSKNINSIFKVFDDYFGCALTVQMVNYRSIITPRLYFKVLQNYDGGIDTGFIPTGTANSGDLIKRITRVADSQKVAMTDELSDVVSDLTIGNGTKPSYKETIINGTCYIELNKLDISKIMKMIYGDKDKNGGKAFYQINPVLQLNQHQYGGVDNWSVSIMRINEANLNDAAQKLGIVVGPANGPRAVTVTD